jgi:predicted secreted protein
VKNEYRNNYWLWIGVIVPWIAGLVCSAAIGHTCRFLPSVGNLEALAIFFGLFAGAPALCLSGGRWPSVVFACAIGLAMLAFSVGVLLGTPDDAPAAMRFARVAVAQTTMSATVWSFAFGWIAIRVGDIRYAAAQPRGPAARAGRPAS